MTEREIGQIFGVMEGIEKQIDALVKALNQHTQEEDLAIAKIDARTTELEKWHWRIVGGGAVAAFFMPILTSVGTALAIQALTSK